MYRLLDNKVSGVFLKKLHAQLCVALADARLLEKSFHRGKGLGLVVLKNCCSSVRERIGERPGVFIHVRYMGWLERKRRACLNVCQGNARFIAGQGLSGGYHRHAQEYGYRKEVLHA